MASPPFRFKKFEIDQSDVAHPVGTDSVLLGAWAPLPMAPTPAVLDIGTGTGIVSLMVAQRLLATGHTNFTVHAVEVHAGSAACAARNFANSPWRPNLSVTLERIQDFRSPLGEKGYNLIVSNPPFFSEITVPPNADRRLVRHTSLLKWTELIESAKKNLAKAGVLALVLPVQEGKRLQEISTMMGLYCTHVTEVFTKANKKAERLLLLFEENPIKFTRNQLVLFDDQEKRLPAFHELTKEFYINKSG